MLDIIQRYAPVADEIRRFPPPDKRIVEVGGTGEGIGWYLPDFEIIDCDIDFVEKILANVKPIKVSGVKLPFPDDYVEVVVSVDMLEHLPSAKKQALAIREMLRVAKKKVILGIPCGEASFKTVKKFASMFYKKHPGQKYQYLEEHLNYGHPEKEEIIKMIKKSGFKVSIRTEENTNNRLWLLYQKIFLAIPQLYHILRYRKFWYDFLRPVFPLFSRGETLRTIFFIEVKKSA